MKKRDVILFFISSLKNRIFIAILILFLISMGGIILSTHNNFSSNNLNNKTILAQKEIKQNANDNKIDNKIDNSKKTLPKTKLLRLKKTKNGVKAVWKKAKVKVSGYQIQYSVSKKFKKAKTVTIKRKKASTFNIKKLKRGKKYFVRVRYFEISNGIKNYSLWSNTKSIKIKR